MPARTSALRWVSHPHARRQTPENEFPAGHRTPGGYKVKLCWTQIYLRVVTPRTVPYSHMELGGRRINICNVIPFLFTTIVALNWETRSFKLSGM